MTSHTVNLGPSHFGDPLTRLSGPGPGQWVTKTHPWLYQNLVCSYSDIDRRLPYCFLLGKYQTNQINWAI